MNKYHLQLCILCVCFRTIHSCVGGEEKIKKEKKIPPNNGKWEILLHFQVSFLPLFNSTFSFKIKKENI